MKTSACRALVFAVTLAAVCLQVSSAAAWRERGKHPLRTESPRQRVIRPVAAAALSLALVGCAVPKQPPGYLGDESLNTAPAAGARGAEQRQRSVAARPAILESLRPTMAQREADRLLLGFLIERLTSQVAHEHLPVAGVSYSVHRAVWSVHPGGSRDVLAAPFRTFELGRLGVICQLIDDQLTPLGKPWVAIGPTSRHKEPLELPQWVSEVAREKKTKERIGGRDYLVYEQSRDGGLPPLEVTESLAADATIRWSLTALYPDLFLQRRTSIQRDFDVGGRHVGTTIQRQRREGGHHRVLRTVEEVYDGKGGLVGVTRTRYDSAGKKLEAIDQLQPKPVFQRRSSGDLILTEGSQQGLKRWLEMELKLVAGERGEIPMELDPEWMPEELFSAIERGLNQLAGLRWKRELSSSMP